MAHESYDAVVIGGAFSGAVFSTLLRRWRPESKVLIVETSEAFDRKVGEATVEISSFMLHQVLGLHDTLAREQLPKHGLRYWFTDHQDRSLAEMTEVGPAEVPRLPAFQLDRSKMDQTLLDQAVEGGAELMRPAKVTQVDLGWPQSQVTIDDGNGGRTVSTRWVLDASGRHAFLGRRLKLRKRTEEHPTAAVWGRWSGVKDLDGPEVLGNDPRNPTFPPIAPARRLATNHFCGHGWWVWMIPLAGGDTSVGLVYDKRFFQWPSEGGAMERYRHFMATQPGLRELLTDAALDEEDFRSYSHLPYSSTRYADRGWMLMGDAAAFLDPFYSPGLDYASICAYSSSRLVARQLDGELDEAALGEAIDSHNDRFVRSYRRWLNALYLDKYETFGDAELTGAGFSLDTAMYYMGVITPIHADIDELNNPLFGQPILATKLAYRFMRFYNQRLVKLARLRRKQGTYGRRNANWRCLVNTAGIGIPGGMVLFRAGAKLWLRAELSALWGRLRGARAPQNPMPEAAEAEAAS